MITLNASADYGHTGQYVARITGRDSKFTFAREFIGRKHGKRGESSSADVDEPGLYELRDVTRKGKIDRYRLVLAHNDELVCLKSDKEDAMTIAKELDKGRAFEEIVRVTLGDNGEALYEILSAKEAEKAASAASVGEAIALCWAAIEGLDDKQRKAVMAGLNRRSEILSALYQYDRGDGSLGIIVDRALVTDPDCTIDEVRKVVMDAERDDAAWRENLPKNDSEAAYLAGRADYEEGVEVDTHRARRWAHSSVV